MVTDRHWTWWVVLGVLATRGAGAAPIEFGFGKVEITPARPVRLAGYGNRNVPFEGVADRLFARAIALRNAEGAIAVLVSADCIGFSGSLATELARQVEDRHGIPRDRFVLCAIHSHTAPQLAGYLTNHFLKALGPEEEAEVERYTAEFRKGLSAAVESAIKDLAPGQLSWGQGRAGFAANRRVLREGKWSGFGVNPDGPVDHAVPVLRVTDPQGRVRGVVYGYACHCTTLPASFNQVSGDWAGHASAEIEDRHRGAVALAVIGCGADANPEPRGTLEMARVHGRTLALEIERLLAGRLEELSAWPETAFGYAALPFDRPTRAELEQRLGAKDPREVRRAQFMLETLARKGRLPETYPCPVQMWRFDAGPVMVFLGGEVVVDYGLRLKKEIAGGKAWVTAYANDVFGYVASERVRREGGYEVDQSMLSYQLPGRFSSGTEEVLVRRVHDLLSSPAAEKSLSPEEALRSFRLPPGLEIELVAAEPLVADPINIAFDERGRLWVVEMGDYPLGIDGQGKPGGRVKLLEDSDRDGRFDRSTSFLEGLRYPTGVMPWRDGVLVSAAPAILFARDTDRDGRADQVEELFTGFAKANPQHQLHGFAYGLDHWLYIGGDHGGRIESRNGAKAVLGSDARIRPDAGTIEPASGRSQYIRSRDDWGNWFGGNNSRPIEHFVVEDRYLRRNPHVALPEPKRTLLGSVAIFPASRTAERFNDVFAANRFTSACSPMIYRDELLAPAMGLAKDAGKSSAGALAFVCEPVHNLVHRLILEPDGVTFRAARHPQDESSEFLAATDGWCRPVRVVDGPDGALWVVDMYRQVIEHPEWIPDEWQARLDLRAGCDQGRIYRVFPSGRRPGPWPILADRSTQELVAALESPNGWQRDTAQRLLIHRGDPLVVPSLERMVREGGRPTARLHALSTLDALGALAAGVVRMALGDPHPGVRRRALRLAEPRLGKDPELGRAVAALVTDSEIRVRHQLALTLGEWSDPLAGELLGRLAAAGLDDSWLRQAVAASAVPHAESVWRAVLAGATDSPARSELCEWLIATAAGASGPESLGRLVASIADMPSNGPGPSPQGGQDGIEAWRLAAMAVTWEASERRGLDLAETIRSPQVRDQVARIVENARKVAPQEDARLEDRLASVRLLGREARRESDDLDLLRSLCRPQSPPQLQAAAVAAIARTRHADAASGLLAGWGAYPPALRSQVLGIMLSRPAWIGALLDAIQAGTVLPMDLDASQRDRLWQQSHGTLRQRARDLVAAAQPRDRQRLLEEYRSALGRTGDPRQGAELFAKRCAACHRYRGTGTDLGASLENLKDRSPEALFVAILDPNRAVEPKYRNYVAATTDGRILSGMIVEETAAAVTLAFSNGTRESLLRSQIDELVATPKSFMPEGLEADLTPAQVADIIALLAQ